MAKDLPYLKFNVAEWISGAITLEDFYTQGVFINICAHYWFKSGCLTLTEIKRRVKCKQHAFDTLIENNLIKVADDVVSISFLDEQLNERNAKREINKANGMKGGAPVGNKNAIKYKQETTEKQPKTTNIEKRREEQEERREEESGAGSPATLEERAFVFFQKLEPFLSTYSKEMLRAFYDYWTEKNEGGRKMRFEMQKVFDVSRRLTTWSNNEKSKINGITKTGQGTREDKIRTLQEDFGNRVIKGD